MSEEKQYIGSQEHWEDSINEDYDRQEQYAKDMEPEQQYPEQPYPIEYYQNELLESGKYIQSLLAENKKLREQGEQSLLLYNSMVAQIEKLQEDLKEMTEYAQEKRALLLEQVELYQKQYSELYQVRSSLQLYFTCMDNADGPQHFEEILDKHKWLSIAKAALAK